MDACVYCTCDTAVVLVLNTQVRVLDTQVLVLGLYNAKEFTCYKTCTDEGCEGTMDSRSSRPAVPGRVKSVVSRTLRLNNLLQTPSKYCKLTCSQHNSQLVLKLGILLTTADRQTDKTPI